MNSEAGWGVGRVQGCGGSAIYMQILKVVKESGETLEKKN